ncbi:MAG: hypothetical protein U0P30_04105 [Vicinamibacterales bacterium]
MRAMRWLVMAAVLAMTSVPRAQTATPAVDRLFRISGILPGPAPVGAAANVVLGIYDDATDGVPLWQEVQAIAVGAGGLYTVLVGATSADGVPPELFATGEPRWLGITGQWPGAEAAPRTLLTSVPYAVRAARASDADALGGLPASAYLRVRGSGTPRGEDGTAATTAGTAGSSRATDPLVNAGTAGRIGKFVSGTDLGDSVMTESAGRIGVGTPSPLDTMSVRFTDTGGAFTGYAVQNLGGTAASYSGMLFYDQNGALGQFQGFNNSTHEYRINNIASGGSINFMLNSASLFRVTSGGTIADGGASNAGLTGTTASPAFRVAGLAGINTHPSAQSLGVLGQATASPIGTGVNGFGSITGGYFEATGNPSGGFNPTGLYGAAGGSAGTGVVGTGASQGMYAEATGLFGVGLKAKAPALGFAIDTEGSIRQQRTDGGAVKAMARVDAAGNILQCFNSQATGSSCGIGVTRVSTGHYAVDFGFQVNDRPFVTQPLIGPASAINQGIVISEPATQITLVPFNNSGPVDNAFVIVIF